jgi:hypothetical protein
MPLNNNLPPVVYKRRKRESTEDASILTGKNSKGRPKNSILIFLSTVL